MAENAVVAVYNTHTEAEAAVKELQRSGFDMKRLSIVGKDYHTEEHIVGYYNTGDRMRYWGKLGAFWGGLWGFLFGSALLEGAAITGGLTALGAALYGIGIPKNSVLEYETALQVRQVPGHRARDGR